ncbi:MAG TPA: HNH endonuclease family protein [Actinoplanes sp.]
MTPRPGRRIAAAIAAGLLTLGVLAGCDVIPVEPGGGDSGGDTSAGDPTGAAARLGKLTVAKAASMRGYSREKFPHWRSTGENCDVRDTVLKRDGTKVRTSGCNVVAGTWTSVYDGLTIAQPAKMDVDHMVPLANAWRSGAASWTDAKRGDFANDLDRPQLIAVSATSNRAKGDQDPSTWKPKVTGIWCQYAQDWIAVKSHWRLWVTTAEKAALTDMLEKC